MKKKHAAAIVHFEKALRITPDDANAKQYLEAAHKALNP
jgi:hypothetical protein